jgi:hypothetical protein
MGLGDFILIIDKLGIFGVILTFIFLSVIFMGAMVDIFQFLWVMKRLRNRRSRAMYEKVKAQVLLDQYEHVLRQKKELNETRS